MNTTFYRLSFPPGLTIDQVASWLSSISTLTSDQSVWLLTPPTPVICEIVATNTGIEHHLIVPSTLHAKVLSGLRATLPSVRLEEIDPELLPPQPSRLAVELRLTNTQQQLAVDRADVLTRQLLSSLQPLRPGERMTWQWIFVGARTPSLIPATGQPVNRAVQAKRREPLLNVVGRLSVESAHVGRSRSLLSRTSGAVRLLNVPGAGVVQSWWPSSVVAKWMDRRQAPQFRVWPLQLNSKELSGLLAFPLGNTVLPGLAAASARQLPPPVRGARGGTVLADSTYPGSAQPLAFSREDRTRHVWLMGATGVGKSTLMASVALQDIARGDGLAVIDPKGDLVADILARIPDHRRDDVIVLDPADTARPIGFNVLASSGSEASRELAVDQILHVLHEQWRSSWGPRTDAILRAALLTLVSVPAANGEAYTLCEVSELLTNARFRRRIVSHPLVPVSTVSFWRWFDSLSSAEHAQVIAPVINKLSAFSQRTSLRLLLGQSKGLDLRRCIAERKILLVPLARGQIGAETTSLLASLLVAGLWHAALGRTAIPIAKRRPWWLHIDELQQAVRLPVELADMCAEARGLGVGLVVANQHLHQLPDSVRHALVSTGRSQVIFQVAASDARLLAPSFAPHLSEYDLRSLPTYEVAMRLSTGGQTARPVTGMTRPLPPATTDGAALRALSRSTHGVDRAAIEQGLRDRIANVGGDSLIGKRKRGDDS